MGETVNLGGRETDHARFERLLRPHFDVLYRAASRLATPRTWYRKSV